MTGAARTCEFAAPDGVTLSGRWFGDRGAPVLIAPATGIRQSYYAAFATWLADRGHLVLTFDFRGIGASRTGPLIACKADLSTWGSLDMVAALDALLAVSGTRTASLIGHSAGGQLMGLMSNADRLACVVGVAASTGWFATMRPAYRLRARLIMQGYLPFGSALLGYAPCRAIGLGEDLPAGVARDWAAWCAAGGYARNALSAHPELDHHARVTCPITALYADDDDIANDGSVADLLRTFPDAITTPRRVSPASVGYDTIGHMAWFHPSRERLWPLIARELLSGDVRA